MEITPNTIITIGAIALIVLCYGTIIYYSIKHMKKVITAATKKDSFVFTSKKTGFYAVVDPRD
jgi:hypothetical protein